MTLTSICNCVSGRFQQDCRADQQRHRRPIRSGAERKLGEYQRSLLVAWRVIGVIQEFPVLFVCVTTL